MKAEELVVVDVPKKNRTGLDWILDESFEGWYLWHSRKTLRDVEIVKAAMLSHKPVGLVMLKTLEEGVGYVYYIAVARRQRKKGIGKLLLNHSLKVFKDSGVKEIFASVEEDNAPSEALFAAEGFERTNYADVSKEHGSLHTLYMYREMTVVPGEILLRKTLA